MVFAVSKSSGRSIEDFATLSFLWVPRTWKPGKMQFFSLSQKREYSILFR